MVGPIVPTTPETVDHTPMAHERRSSGNVAMMMAKADGVSMAPPQAATTRAAMRNCTLGAIAHRPEPKEKSVMLRTKILRRPRRSAMRPAGISNAAATIE